MNHNNPPNIANNLIASKYIIVISIVSITFNCIIFPIHDNPPNIANNLIEGKYIILISVTISTIHLHVTSLIAGKYLNLSLFYPEKEGIAQKLKPIHV